MFKTNRQGVEHSKYANNHFFKYNLKNISLTALKFKFKNNANLKNFDLQKLQFGHITY